MRLCIIQADSPRRISAKCRITSDICVTAERLFEPDISGEGEYDTSITLQRKSDSVRTISETSFFEEDLRFSDDIEIESSLPPIADIISCNISIIPEECKQSDDTIPAPRLGYSKLPVHIGHRRNHVGSKETADSGNL